MRLLAPKRIEKTSGVSDTADCCITDQLSNIVIMASTGDLGEYEYKNDAFEEDGQPMSGQHESAALKELVPSFWLSVVYVCKTYLFRNTKITQRCVNYPHLLSNPILRYQ